jgi:hypothetical protein
MKVLAAFTLLIVMTGACLAADVQAAQPTDTLQAASLLSPSIVLKPTALAGGASILLGDMATITAPTALAGKLSSVVVGCVPMAGLNRTLTKGDVILKLRQAGIDPSGLHISGALVVTVSVKPDHTDTVSSASTAGITTVTGANAGSSQAASTNAAASKTNAVLIKSGALVTVVYEDGPVTVSLQGALVGSASIGDTVSVRTTSTNRLMRGQLVDEQTVKL